MLKFLPILVALSFSVISLSLSVNLQFARADNATGTDPTDGIVISEISTRTESDAHEEFIEFYNQKDATVDISGWKLEYSAITSDIWRNKIRAVQYVEPNYEIDPNDFYVLATENFSLQNEDIIVDRTISSGSAESGGFLRLSKPAGENNTEEWVEVDIVGWTSDEELYLIDNLAKAASRGSSITRCFTDGAIINTRNNFTDFIISEVPMPGQKVACPDNTEEPEDEHTSDDTNDSNDDYQDNDSQENDDSSGEESEGSEEIEGEEQGEENAIEETPDESLQSVSCEGVVFSELLPNPQGPRSEHPREDNAYIELYNTTNEVVNMVGCGLQTSANSNEFWFDEGATIDPDSHLSLYERDTGVQLPVSPSGTVYLLAESGEKAEEIESATYPKDMPEAASWSWFGNDTWEKTYALTPGAINERMPLKPCPEGQERNPETNRCRSVETDNTSSLTPCLEGQERNPATNRCRSIGSQDRDLVPCAPHQERNPDTNRCRSIQSSSRQLVPCKPHQERNPETNRCRNINSASSDLVPCGEGQERNPETNRCRNVAAPNSGALGVQDIPVAATTDNNNWPLIGALAGFALLYGAWEWRHDLKRLYLTAKMRQEKLQNNGN